MTMLVAPFGALIFCCVIAYLVARLTRFHTLNACILPLYSILSMFAAIRFGFVAESDGNLLLATFLLGAYGGALGACIGWVHWYGAKRERIESITPNQSFATSFFRPFELETKNDAHRNTHPRVLRRRAR